LVFSNGFFFLIEYWGMKLIGVSITTEDTFNPVSGEELVNKDEERDWVANFKPGWTRLD